MLTNLRRKPQKHRTSETFEQDVRRFSGELKKIISSRNEIPAGQVNLIGMDSLRDTLSDQWDKIADTVHEITRRTIMRHLSNEDAYIRYDNDDYLIVFGRLSENAARAKCMAIANEIQERLLGRDETDSIKVSSGVRTSDGSFDFLSYEQEDLRPSDGDKIDIGSADPDAILSRMENRGFKIDDDTETPRSPDRDINADDASDDRADSASPTGSAPTIDYLEELSATIANTIGQKRSENRDGFRYVPIWDLNRKVVSTFRCVPSAAYSANGRRLPDPYSDKADQVDRLAKVDLEMLNDAILTLDRMIEAGNHMFMCVEVHYSTLSIPAYRRFYQRAAGGIPDDMRRYLVLDISGMPEGVPQSRIIDLITGIRTLSRIQWVRCEPGVGKLARLSNLGIHAAGLDIGFRAMEESLLFERISRMVTECFDNKMHVYLRGITTSSQLLAACANGVRFVEGEPLGEVLDEPLAAHRYDWNNYYKTYLVDSKRPAG